MIEARLAANFYEGYMIPFHLDSSEKLFFDTFRLGCEAHSLIGLRLFEMATGGVPARHRQLDRLWSRKAREEARHTNIYTQAATPVTSAQV